MTTEDDANCPLCMETMDATDRATHLCTSCDYSICLWCFHHIMEDANIENSSGRCPNCRTVYNAASITMERINPEDLEKSVRKQKSRSKGRAISNPQAVEPDTSQNYQQLNNVRVVQQNLVYVVGLAPELCQEELLQDSSYFGKFGRPLKVFVSRSASPGVPVSKGGPSGSAYVTFRRPEEAGECIAAIDGTTWHGRTVRACLGTTKYCNSFLKGVPCNSKDCLYVHAIAEEDTYSKGPHAAMNPMARAHSHPHLHHEQSRDSSGVSKPALSSNSAAAASALPAQLSSEHHPPSFTSSQISATLPTTNGCRSDEPAGNRESEVGPGLSQQQRTHRGSTVAGPNTSWPAQPPTVTDSALPEWPALSGTISGAAAPDSDTDPITRSSSTPHTMAAQLARTTSMPSAPQQATSNQRPSNGRTGGGSTRTVGRTMVPPPPQISLAAASSRVETASPLPLLGKLGRDSGANAATKSFSLEAPATTHQSTHTAHPSSHTEDGAREKDAQGGTLQHSSTSVPHVAALPGARAKQEGSSTAVANDSKQRTIPPRQQHEADSALRQTQQLSTATQAGEGPVAGHAPPRPRLRVHSGCPPPGFEDAIRQRPPQPLLHNPFPSHCSDTKAAATPHLPLQPVPHSSHSRQPSTSADVRHIGHPKPQSSENSAPFANLAQLPAELGRQSRFPFARTSNEAASEAQHINVVAAEEHRAPNPAAKSVAASRKPPPGFEAGLPQARRHAPQAEVHHDASGTPQVPPLPPPSSYTAGERQQSGALLLRQLRGSTRRQPDVTLAAAVQAASAALTGVFADPAILGTGSDRPGSARKPNESRPALTAPVSGRDSKLAAATTGPAVPRVAATPRPNSSRSDTRGSGAPSEGKPSSKVAAESNQTASAQSNEYSAGSAVLGTPSSAAPRSTRGGRKKRGGKGRNGASGTTA